MEKPPVAGETQSDPSRGASNLTGRSKCEPVKPRKRAPRETDCGSVGSAEPLGDAATAAKQAGEFGIQAQGQKLVGLLIDVVDLRAIGLPSTQGMLLTNAFYWDRDDETRAFSKRFFDRHGRMPTQFQAGVYSSIMHYLKAVQAAGTDEAKVVVAKMREMPVNDFYAKNGKIREDGRMVHDMYLMQVKGPAESKGEWDLFKLVETIPGDRAFRPL